MLNRFEANGFLTVSADTRSRETVMINGSSVSGNTMLELTNQSTIYLGGLPANLSVNIDIMKFIYMEAVLIFTTVIWREPHNLPKKKRTVFVVSC